MDRVGEPTETPRNAVDSLMKRIKQPASGAGFAAMPYADLPALMTTCATATRAPGGWRCDF